MKFGLPCLGKSAAVAKVCKREVYTDLGSRLDLILHNIFSVALTSGTNRTTSAQQKFG